MTYVISIINQKGGVGKTTTAVNLATSMAAFKKKILLIDLDPQGNASTGLGISRNQKSQGSYEFLIQKTSSSHLIKETMIPFLDVLPASENLAGAEIELAYLENREFFLKKQIDTLDYDYILIDCPPSLGLLTINALVSSDSIIIPLQCEYYALEGLSQILKTLQIINKSLNPSLKLEGIVLTMFDGRNSLSHAVEKDVRSFLGDKVFQTFIPRNIRVSEAPSHGLPVILYDIKSPGAQAYIRLATELLKRIMKENI